MLAMLYGEFKVVDGVFRNRGLSVVVDTTDVAEYDFQLHGISDQQISRIGTLLKATPHSMLDRSVGSIRFRDVLNGEKEVAYLLTQDRSEVVVLILGIDDIGKLESRLNVLKRAGMSSLPPYVAELLKGRRRKE